MTTEPAKPKAKKATKPAADHPKYIEMVVFAINALKERGGSSRQAIIKYVKANYKVGDNTETHIKLALKRGVASGTLIQVKGRGASGSFKVANKSEVKPAKKKKEIKKPAPKKKTLKKVKKRPPTKKPAAKKTVTKKSKAKKPVASKAKSPAQKSKKKAAPKKVTKKAKSPAKKQAAKKAK